MKHEPTARRATSRQSRRRRAVARRSQRDPFLLYQSAVQTPEADIAFAERVFRRANGRRPLSLREDFAGTALLARRWVASHPDRTAVAIDVDPVPLEWAAARAPTELGEAASRLRLKEGNVLSVRTRPVDLLTALNFSYFCLRRRAELLAYFRRAWKAIQPGGLLILDAFGGPEGMEILEEHRRVGRATYSWEQASFDPVTHRLKCHIHFRLADGTRLDRAFTYDWRLWSLPEICDCLADAGFGAAEVYLESLDQRGRGTGSFRRARTSEPLASFVAFIVARRPLVPVRGTRDRRTSSR